MLYCLESDIKMYMNRDLQMLRLQMRIVLYVCGIAVKSFMLGIEKSISTIRRGEFYVNLCTPLCTAVSIPPLCHCAEVNYVGVL